MRSILFFLIFVTSSSAVVFNHTNSSGKIKLTSWIEIKNKNLVRQKFDFSCGSASLATIMNYYYDNNLSEIDIVNSVAEQKGIKVETIEDYYEHKDTGLSFFDLSEYSKKIGYRGLGLAIDFEVLKKLKMPVILFVKIRSQEHFTVFKGMDDRYIYLADPSYNGLKNQDNISA